MRINGINKVNSVYKVGAPKKVDKINSSNNGKDTFSISELAKDLQTAKTHVNKAPDIRQDKVEEVKKRINSGTYNVGAKEVADKIVERFFDESI